MTKLKNKWIQLMFCLAFVLMMPAINVYAENDYTHLNDDDKVWICTWTKKYDAAQKKYVYVKYGPYKHSIPTGGTYYVLKTKVDEGYKPYNKKLVWNANDDFDPNTTTNYTTANLADYCSYGAMNESGGAGTFRFMPRSTSNNGGPQYAWKYVEDQLGINHDTWSSKTVHIIAEQTPVKLRIYFYNEADKVIDSLSLSCDYNSTFTVPSVVNEEQMTTPAGYHTDWYYKETYNAEPKKITDFNVSTYCTKNDDTTLNLTPQHVKNDYTITYELEGGQAETTLPSTYQISETDIQIPSLSAQGKEFDGWSYKKEGSSVWNKMENNKLPAGTFGNITLKASWIYEAKSYMHYNPSGFVTSDIYRMGLKVAEIQGVTDMVETQTLTSRSSATELSQAAYECTAQGYHFDGWYFTQDFKESSKVVFSAYPVTQDTHMYAKWSCEQHSFKPIAGTAQTATCTKAGKEADQKCEKCGATIEGKTIPALGHDYVYSKDLSTEPTQTAVGSKIYLCSRCEDIKIETIPKLPNDDTVPKDDTGSGSDTPQTSQTDNNKPADKEQKQDADKPSDAAPSVPDKQTTATPAPNTDDPKRPISDSEGNQFKKTNYTNGTFELEFTGTNAAGDVQIPSTVKNGNDVMKVTSIASEAFKDNKQITSVILPSGIKKVGDNTFKGATNLKSVVIPSSVTVIGKSAFEKTALTKIVIPDSVKTIEKGAYKNVQAKTLKIGKGVTVIGDSAFEGCKKLKSVTIPGKVTKIGKKAFYNCKSLKRVVFKGIKFKKAGSKAFKKCKKGILFKCPKEKLKAYKKLLKGKY